MQARQAFGGGEQQQKLNLATRAWLSQGRKSRAWCCSGICRTLGDEKLMRIRPQADGGATGLSRGSQSRDYNVFDQTGTNKLLLDERLEGMRLGFCCS